MFDLVRSASPYIFPLDNFVLSPFLSFFAIARASDKPFALIPLLLKRIILSPDRIFLSDISLFLFLIIPIAEPPKAAVSFSIIPFNVGVSPPPHDAPDKSQAFFQPATKFFMRFLSANQALFSTAQYA